MLAEARRPVVRNQRYHLPALGLSVEADWPLPGSTPGSPAESFPGRRASIRLVSRQSVDAAWNEPADRIFEPEYPDGHTPFTVDVTAHQYRLWFQGFGRYLVSHDGTTIRCEIGAVPRDRQERFVFAQVLPLAAALQGIELLHASAVCGKRGVAAFIGPSGTGKTTLASRLVLRGAEFVTDDVLALEVFETEVLTHPGPPFMALPNGDESLIDCAAGRLGSAVGMSDKLHASPQPAAEEMPLKAIFYVDRDAPLPISRLDDGDAHRLLASAFAPYLMTPVRLHRHLEIAHLVSQQVNAFRLKLSPANSFHDTLKVVESQLRELDI